MRTAGRQAREEPPWDIPKALESDFTLKGKVLDCAWSMDWSSFDAEQVRVEKHYVDESVAGAYKAYGEVLCTPLIPRL